MHDPVSELPRIVVPGNSKSRKIGFLPPAGTAELLRNRADPLSPRWARRTGAIVGLSAPWCMNRVSSDTSSGEDADRLSRENSACRVGAGKVRGRDPSPRDPGGIR